MSKKKGGKDMRLLDEISSLQNKISDIEQQLKEERKVHDKLQMDMEERLHLIAAADAAKAAEYERHLNHRRQMLEEKSRVETEKKKSIEDMKNFERTLAHDISNFDIIMEENEKLHDTLKKLTMELQQQQARNALEKEKKTQKNFDFSITMESILRREVKSLYENYQKHAVLEMDDEATDAWKENKKLLLELQKRIDASMELISNHQRSYETLKRTRIREEVQKHNCRMKQRSAMALTRYTEKQEELIRKILDVEETLRSDFEDSRDMFETKSRLQEEVASKSSELNKSFTLREKLKETVVGQVQTLVDSALQFTGRDRVNTVTGLLEGGGEHWVDDSLVASEVALSEREEEMSSSLIFKYCPDDEWSTDRAPERPDVTNHDF